MKMQLHGEQLLYFSALDGLRLIAFLTVFIHHLPESGTIPSFDVIQTHGWVGVELFFVISAFLFFYLFEAEYKKNGAVNVRRFYARRLLRIYPLMVTFAIAMIVLTGTYKWQVLVRLFALMAGLDNVETALRDGYSSIPFSAQLWTLSFEFQVYAVIPFVFIAYQCFGSRRFLIGAAAIWIGCTLLRLATVAFGISYLPAWVLPPLRPDSILLGIILSTCLARLSPIYAGIALSGAGAIFFALPPLPTSMISQIFVYPVAAVMCASLVSLALTWRPLFRVLSLRFVTFAGTISFGLYVFHFLGIFLARRIFDRLGLTLSPESNAAHCLVLALTAFAFTFALSTISYLWFESPFLRLKDRLAAVHGRPIL